MNPALAELGRRALAGGQLDREQGRWLAGLEGDDLYDLFHWANQVRLKYFGRKVTFCSIAATNIGGCSEDCKFCAQSARYKTTVSGVTGQTPDQLVRAAEQAADNGAECFGLVASGRGPTDAELDRLSEPLGRIAAAGRVRPCASLGQVTAEQACRLFALGVRRYNHNLETSRRFYGQVVSTHSYDDRLRTLHNVRSAGIGLCCGGIFNLGEDWDDRIDLALAIRQLGVDMTPLNFLHPIPGTPLADRPPMPPLDILKVVAVFRLLLPDTPLKLAGGREVNLRDLQSWMFYCGATSCMVGNYLTTCGRPVEEDQRMVRDLGLTWTAGTDY